MTERPELDEHNVADAWEANAPTWVRHVRAGYDRYRELFTLPAFLEFLPDLRGLDVIDLGCGEGCNTRVLALAGARMTGVDISSQMIAAARNEEEAHALGITYRVDSFTRLESIPDGSFDAAVSTMALMDSPDFAAAACTARRILRPGGGLYLSVLHPCFITQTIAWQRDEAGQETHLMVGDYFSGEHLVERWRFSKAPETAQDEPFVVPRFGYRLEHYINGLVDAGFRIQRIAEPRPSTEASRAHPWLMRWRRHAPLILCVAATKD